MAEGTVDFFNDTGGYGFIETDAADDDVFFHMEDVGGPDLEEGQEVEFEIEEAEKGPRATNLTRL
ncbi:cold-shock protein [Halorhabdus sp. CBA1104]|jgi:CspA family cold shock protein|uniref:cold-shock protein n=1 Tax=unclassified Halorhabdus TaxID=2621901 RepID=UPI0012B263FA|nr:MULTISPECIES: cold shock domain-containing protein [unclassified Halorhabdus]QGN06719.1 cold-shock protein [Halorhabdus sp. CBA1104]